jgi:hypothetical protein
MKKCCEVGSSRLSALVLVTLDGARMQMGLKTSREPGVIEAVMIEHGSKFAPFGRSQGFAVYGGQSE